MFRVPWTYNTIKHLIRCQDIIHHRHLFSLCEKAKHRPCLRKVYSKKVLRWEVGVITIVIRCQLGIVKPLVLDLSRPKVGDNNNAGGSVNNLLVMIALLLVEILIRMTKTTTTRKSGQRA